MFERRLKIVLLILASVVFVLIGRAAQVQIIRRDYWRGQAAETMKRTHLVKTARGEILDRDGKVLAIDKPCIDACIDYRALTSPPDEQWVKATALARLQDRYGDGWKQMTASQRVALRLREDQAVKSDVEQMWAKLAKLSGRSIDDIEESRQAIVHRVQMRQRYVWYRRYKEAMANGGKKVDPSSWKKWIIDGGSDAPAVDSFEVTVSEQLEPHVILPAVDLSTQNQLAKDLDQYPGLVLRPGTRRFYPYDDVACQLLGHLARVGAENLKDNKSRDELRAYLPNDLIGAAGIEELCEPALRGTRGRIDKTYGEESVLGSLAPVPGQDVKLTIDIELQQQIQSAFADARIRNSKGVVTEEDAVLHGAAVVLDVATDQVLALVSYPTYDLNQYDALYPTLRFDEMNDALRNRATMSKFEPGSTVKPLCGLAGITEGVVGVNEGIECTGFLVLDGHTLKYGRCWMASKFANDPRVPSVAHHCIPFPHVGHDGNKDGWLTYSDALERSCNVYFETVADRLKIDRLSMWYKRFGLGRPTGLGIGEAWGRVPSSFPSSAPPARRRIIGFSGGIGQGFITATPIQMANAAAMIARDGIWMRPKLLLPDAQGKLSPTRPGAFPDEPDRVDLHLPPEALRAAKLGMYNVVNAPSGTGKAIVAGDKMLQSIGIAGKTGTAQAALFRIHKRDASGQIVLDANKHPVYLFPQPSTDTHPNPQAPWYRAADEEGKQVNHAWYIGFAPADHPKIAFGVLVEYGASGGISAASVARSILEAAITRGYLQVPGVAVGGRQ